MSGVWFGAFGKPTTPVGSLPSTANVEDEENAVPFETTTAEKTVWTIGPVDDKVTAL